MDFSLSSSLVGSAVSNPDKLALDLQFAADKTLTARKGPTPVLTRASSATFVGSDGLIQSAGNNVARFDHDPVSLVCKGLLIEESRTNSIADSNAFNNWSMSNSTVAASSVANPEGSLSAWKAVEDLLLANHTVSRSFTPVSGTTYTASMWLKSAENGFAFMGLSGGGFATTFISVNLSTGAVSTATGTPIGATSVAHSNGWRRVSFSLAATASLSSTLGIRLSRDGDWANRSYLGNGVNGIYVYGAQVEAGIFPTSYIPTTTASVIRSVDVCSISGSDFSGMYNQPEGTFVTSSSRTSTNANAFIGHYSDNSFSNGFDVRYSTSTQVSPLMNVANSNQLTGMQVTITAGSVVNQAFSYKLNDCGYSVNGAATITDTSALIPTATRMAIGNAAVPSTTLYLNGTISSMRYFKKRLANAKLQALTA